MMIEQMRARAVGDPNEFSGPLQTSIVTRSAASAPSPWTAYHATLGELLGAFDTAGYWRMDLETGMLYWSETTFRIFGLEQRDGPVDFIAAMQCFHPDDRDLFLQLIEEATEAQSRFEAVLRLGDQNGRYKFIRCLGTFRTTSDDGAEQRGELVGFLSELSERIRAVRILE